MESVFTHTKDLNFEIIVLDNASTERDAGEFKNRFPNIHLIQSETNLGFAKGNNLAIQSCKGEVLLLLNSDTELLENSISICYNDLIKEKETGVITCQLISSGNSTQHNCQSFPSYWKYLFEKSRLHKLVSKKTKSTYLQGHYWNYTEAGYPDWVWGTFFMFKKKVLEALPLQQLYDDYFMYVEDMKWCWDIRKAGYSIKYLPQTKVKHLLGGSSAKANELIVKNQTHFIEENYGKWHAWLLLQQLNS